MGDADLGGDDYGDYFFDDDWLYIEDEVAFADELAESQIPSPGYSGTNAELMLEWYEYDTYEYFGELEYGSDSYWDTTPAKTKHAQEQEQSGNQSPRKRKRTATIAHTEKRRKIQVPDDTLEWQNVVYRPIQSVAKSVPAITEGTAAFALFPDWRERFPPDADVVWRKTMPEDMKRAAQAVDDVGGGGGDGDDDDDDMNDINATHEEGVNNINLKATNNPKTVQQPVRQNKKREPLRTTTPPLEDTLDTTAPDILSSLDPEALRSVLRSKLGDAAMNEEAFMSVISSMLSGAGSADDAVSQLANTLLNQQDDGDDTAINWLQDRGVNMDEDAEEEQLEGRRVDSRAGLAQDLKNEASEDNKRLQSQTSDDGSSGRKSSRNTKPSRANKK